MIILGILIFISFKAVVMNLPYKCLFLVVLVRGYNAFLKSDIDIIQKIL